MLILIKRFSYNVPEDEEEPVIDVDTNEYISSSQEKPNVSTVNIQKPAKKHDCKLIVFTLIFLSIVLIFSFR